jgi:hypothetical protein
MSATALQLNWTNVAFTPTSGSAVTITRVTSCSFNQGTELIDFSGDNDRYPVVIANSVNRPSCDITSGDVATLFGIGGGTGGSVAATQLDALGATGGSIDWAMINCVSGGAQQSGQWGQFATATLHVRCYSTDGTTNPLSFTRA